MVYRLTYKAEQRDFTKFVDAVEAFNDAR